MHVGDDLGGWGKGGLFAGAGGGERDGGVGFGEESVDLGGLGGDRGEGATFDGAAGAWVGGCGDGFRDGFGHFWMVVVKLTGWWRLWRLRSRKVMLAL